MKGVPVICRQSPTMVEIVAIGCDNGFICFFNTYTSETYMCDACDTEGRLKLKQEEYLKGLSNLEQVGHKDEDLRLLGLSKEEVAIEDIRWDPFESNILVTFADGAMSLISYQGFSEKTNVSQQFEKQANSLTSLLWSHDRSGNFFTSSNKVGVISAWNVASKEPKSIFKVGNNGVHQMLRISTKDNEQRVLVALKSGTCLIYDLKRRSIDYSTEAGHSETIFETEFCRANSDYIASCSYDGTVRVWETTTMKLACINDTARGTAQSKLEKRIIYSISWHPT